MRRVATTLGIALVLLAAAIVAVLTQSPVAVSAVNTAQQVPIRTTTDYTRVCQPNEVLPRGTTGVRLRVGAFTGPRVTADLTAGGHVVAQGSQASGWTGGAVTIPVRPRSVTYREVTLCFELFLNRDETAFLIGEPGRVQESSGRAGNVPARVRVEYLHPARSSWWSLAFSVARRMGLSHAPSGTWSVLLVLLVMGSVVVLCTGLTLRDLA